MTPAWLAMALLSLYLLVAFGIKTVVQVRRTGNSGFRGLSGEPGSLQWWAGAAVAFALCVYGLGLVAGLVGWPPFSLLDHAWVRVLGTAMAALGIVASLGTQLVMGTSWRVGVDETERTDLVTTGPFGVVRNPFFTALLFTSAGVALVAPSIIALLGWVLLLAGIELQVRIVEEPYLRRHHGGSYDRYLATVGRFLPYLGRVGPRTTLRT